MSNSAEKDGDTNAVGDESGGGGTLGWNAPERLTQSSNHTKKSDVWSWAIVVRRLLVEKAFRKLDKTGDGIVTGKETFF